MKTRSFLVLLFIFSCSFVNAQSQLGIGVGSRGVVVKSSPTQKFRYSLRFEPNGDFYFAYNADLDVGLNLIREEKAIFYLNFGGGVNTYDTNSQDAEYYFLKLPVGVEYFPFERKNISIAIEAFPSINFSWYRFEVQNVIFDGLVEIAYYF